MTIPILLIEDDSKVAAQITEALRDRFEVSVFEKMQDFIAAAEASPQSLMIIDFDLRETDGMVVFKKLKEQNPRVRCVMISSSNSIPLAVTATKLGILEFLRKPLLTADFKNIIEQLARKDEIYKDEIMGAEWLRGKSDRLGEFKREIVKCARSPKDLVLIAERGINKRSVVSLIHQNGPNHSKKLIEIDLTSFQKESLESHFWATLKGFLSPPGINSLQAEEERPGTIYLEGVEFVSEYFWISIVDFLKKRAGKLGPKGGIKMMVGLCDASLLPPGEEFETLRLPPLRERKEDLLEIITAYLKSNSSIDKLSIMILEFISRYDFYGNYDELFNFILASCPEGQVLEGLNYNKRAFLSSLKSLVGLKSLSLTRETLEKEFLKVLLLKTKNDFSVLARFLDVPKTTLEERVRELDP